MENSNESRPSIFLLCEPNAPDVRSFAELAAQRFNVEPVHIGAFDGTERRQVEASAARIVAMIRLRQLSGPYRLMGWRGAGIVAYEVAARLLGQDETVELLMLAWPEFPRSAKSATEASLDATDTSSKSTEHAHQVGAKASMDVYLIQPLSIRIVVFANDAQEARAVWQVRVPIANFEFIEAGDVAPPSFHRIAATLEASLVEAAFNASAHYDPLLAIQASTSRNIPIYCIPGAGDQLSTYVPFAIAVGDEWPVYGFQPRGIIDERVPHRSIEAAVACYIGAIVPSSAIHLIGHSFGGLVAFEMALELSRRGHSLASLTLLDTEPPDLRGAVRDYTNLECLGMWVEAVEYSAGRKLAIDVSDLAGEEFTTQLFLLHRHLVRERILPGRSAPESLRWAIRTFAANMRTAYIPRCTYDGPLHLFLAKRDRFGNEISGSDLDAQVTGWLNWAPRTSVGYSEGNHATMLRHPHVETIVADWKSALAKETQA